MTAPAWFRDCLCRAERVAVQKEGQRRLVLHDLAATHRGDEELAPGGAVMKGRDVAIPVVDDLRVRAPDFFLDTLTQRVVGVGCRRAAVHRSQAPLSVPLVGMRTHTGPVTR